MKSVRRQPIPIISVLLIGAFLLTSVIGYFVASSVSQTGIAENELPLTSDTIYSELQRDLLYPVLISSLMANDTFLRDWVLDGEIDTGQVARYLKEIKTRYGAYSAFFVSEQTWNYYYPGGTLKQVSADEERDAWYFRVRHMEDEYEINVDPDLANRDEMTIFINYQVRDYNGNYIGATGVGLSVSSVQSIIEEYHARYGRSIYLTRTNGDVQLASADHPFALTNIFNADGGLAYAEAFGQDSRESFQLERNGETMIANVRYIPELDWYLIIEQEVGRPTGPMLSSLLLNLGISLVISIVVILLVNLSVKSYSKSIETLRGIVPICSYCKHVRDDKGYWSQVEAYVSEHSEAQFSHGICPDCREKHFPELELETPRDVPTTD
jgi:cache domain-containing protein